MVGVLPRHSKPMTLGLRTHPHLGWEHSCLLVRARFTLVRRRFSEILLERWCLACRRSPAQREWFDSENEVRARSRNCSWPTASIVGHCLPSDAAARSSRVVPSFPVSSASGPGLSRISGRNAVRVRRSPSSATRCGGIFGVVWSDASNSRRMIRRNVKA